MIKTHNIYAAIIKAVSHKKVKTFLGGNLAFALIATSSGFPSNYVNSQSSLIIPEEKLDISFNIPSPLNTETQSGIQIPIDYIYMSQGFHIFHPGIDLASKFGNPVKPIMSGTVEEAGASYVGYGNEILINHGGGMESLYAHLSKINVKKGDVVDMDTIIGLVGSTGHSTGPHLHLEVHKDGIPVNPLTILPSLTNTRSRLLTSLQP